jgi:hypothetical protein
MVMLMMMMMIIIIIIIIIILWSEWFCQYSDCLLAGRNGDRIPVRAIFSAPVLTSPGAHLASCTMDTASFPGVKRPGRGVNHPPLSNAEVKNRIELYVYICSISTPSWQVIR